MKKKKGSEAKYVEMAEAVKAKSEAPNCIYDIDQSC